MKTILIITDNLPEQINGEELYQSQQSGILGQIGSQQVLELNKPTSK